MLREVTGHSALQASNWPQDIVIIWQNLKLMLRDKPFRRRKQQKHVHVMYRFCWNGQSFAQLQKKHNMYIIWSYLDVCELHLFA